MALAAPDAPIVSSIKDSFGGEVINPQLPSDTPKIDDSFTIKLVLIVILVVLANLAVKEYKHPGYIRGLVSNAKAGVVAAKPSGGKAAAAPIVDEPKADMPTGNEMFNYEEAYKDLSKRVTELEASKNTSSQDMLEVKKKLTLLAIVNDENTMIARRHGQQFVYIDKDWKIDRMPSNIAYDERTRKFLEERIR